MPQRAGEPAGVIDFRVSDGILRCLVLVGLNCRSFLGFVQKEGQFCCRYFYPPGLIVFGNSFEVSGQNEVSQLEIQVS